MTIASELMPGWLTALLWVVLAGTCLVAARYADWPALRAVPVRYHLFFGSVVCCLLLWLMSVNTVSGLRFHFLGVTTLTLLLGWRLAILAGAAAVICHTLLIGQALGAAPAAWLLTVAVPATVSRWLVHRLRKLRSRNLFIYLLGAGFGGGMLSALAAALAAIVVLLLAGHADLVNSGLRNWPLITLLMFPEGFINGMMVTTLTVFYPQLVKTFDDDHYLEDG
jgi:uncharacterized membrane protein